LALLTAQERDVNLEDYVHDYYSVERFQNAYKRLIEPLPDKSHWPHVELPFVVAAPLAPRGVGRQRKLRIKSFLEGGGSKTSKSGEKNSSNEADPGKKQMIRGKRQCKRCGELGHGETSYKCSLNGTKKRKRKPRKNATKSSSKSSTKNKAKKATKTNEEASTSSIPTLETIIQNNPGRVTRRYAAGIILITVFFSS